MYLVVEQEMPNREEMLKAIDFEIERVAKEHKKPGWTEWAIYGGLAIVFWSIISFPFSESFRIIGSAQILLAIFFVYDSLGLFRLIYDAGTSENSAWLTFHRQAYRISPRTQFATIVIRMSLAIVAWIGLSNVWWPQVVIVFLWIILSVVLTAYLFWLWFEDFPVSQFKNQNPSRVLGLVVGFFVAAAVALIVLWAASGYLRAAIAVSDPTDLANQFKLAGLVFAIMFLFEKLFYEPVPLRVVTDLVELRSAFFFNELDTKRAVYALKKLLGRLSPKEFTDGVYEDYQEALDRHEWTIDRATEWLYIQNERIPESIEGLEGIPNADSIKRESLRIFGSEESLASAARTTPTEESNFNRELGRAKWLLSFELNEFIEVKNDIEARRKRIGEKTRHLRSEQARVKGQN